MNKMPSRSFWLRTGGARTRRAATIAFIATTAISGIAIAHAPSRWRPPGIVAVRIAAIAAPIAAESDTIRTKARCTVCGVVESVLPVEGPTAAVEFRVRMHDGTLRTSAADPHDPVSHKSPSSSPPWRSSPSPVAPPRNGKRAPASTSTTPPSPPR